MKRMSETGPKQPELVTILVSNTLTPPAGGGAGIRPSGIAGTRAVSA